MRALLTALVVTSFISGLVGAAAGADEPQPEYDTQEMLEFVYVPAGEFLMGSPPDEVGRHEDEVQHRVEISRPFYIAAREVTQYLWQQVMGSDRSSQYGCPLCPVETVSWYEAVEFCIRLSLRLGREPAYRLHGLEVTWNREADGFRLPTEAEWEYAYRAGTTTTFPTGDCLPASGANINGYLVYRDCPEDMWRGQTLPVASLDPNPWGLYDMGGNVAEWCWDRYGPYRVGDTVDPTGPATGDERVYRGAAFNAAVVHARSAARAKEDPRRPALYRGFRLVFTPGQAQEGASDASGK